LKKFNYIFVEPRVVGKTLYGMKDVGECWKWSKKLLFNQQGPPKRTSWVLKILLFLDVKIIYWTRFNASGYFWFHGQSIISWWFMHYQCLVITFEIIYSTLNVILCI
jgi:hypothetical protein